MKKNDIALIALIASTSAVLTYVISSTVLSGLTQQSTKVPYIQKISSDIVQPDSEIFNTDAINPAVQVNIDGSQ